MSYRKITVALLNTALALHRRVLLKAKADAARASDRSYARVCAQQQVIKHEQAHLGKLIDDYGNVSTDAQAVQHACNSELDALPTRWS